FASVCPPLWPWLFPASCLLGLPRRLVSRPSQVVLVCAQCRLLDRLGVIEIPRALAQQEQVLVALRAAISHTLWHGVTFCIDNILSQKPPVGAQRKGHHPRNAAQVFGLQAVYGAARRSLRPMVCLLFWSRRIRGFPLARLRAIRVTEIYPAGSILAQHPPYLAKHRHHVLHKLFRRRLHPQAPPPRRAPLAEANLLLRSHRLPLGLHAARLRLAAPVGSLRPVAFANLGGPFLRDPLVCAFRLAVPDRWRYFVVTESPIRRRRNHALHALIRQCGQHLQHVALQKLVQASRPFCLYLLPRHAAPRPGSPGHALTSHGLSLRRCLLILLGVTDDHLYD